MPVVPGTALDTGTVTGTYIDDSGNPRIGKSRLTRTQVLKDAGNKKTIVKSVREAAWVSGAFSMTVPATVDPDINPTGWNYLYEAFDSDGSLIESFPLSVSAGATVDVASVAPDSSPSNGTVVFASGGSVDAARILTLATWIAGAIVNRTGNPQGLNGAIGQYPDSGGPAHIKWYQGNQAAQGLAIATAETGDTTHVNRAWTHLARYAAVMDGTTGYVTDRYFNGTAWVPDGNGSGGPNGVGDYWDSTDAYAATFLMALDACYNADPDITRLATFTTAIGLALNAIGGTFNATVGMTASTPTASYQAALLEDNAEVYAGALAGVRLTRALGQTLQASSYANIASTIRSSINSRMWQAGSGWYAAPGRNLAGAYATNTSNASPPNDAVANLSSLASAAMPQAWAVRYGITPAANMRALMDKVHAAQPGWYTTTSYDAALIAVAYQVAGQKARGYGQALEMYRRAKAAGYAWPFTPMAARHLIEAFATRTQIMGDVSD